ncbi:MAG: hypothetical protein R3C02_18270 [Planctomycetaceae bacterium]
MPRLTATATPLRSSSLTRVNLLCDAYGCHYFVDSYGIRHNCFATSIGGRYFYNYGGQRHFVLGY